MSKKYFNVLIAIILLLVIFVVPSYAEKYNWPVEISLGTRTHDSRHLFYTDYLLPLTGSEEDIFFINPKVVTSNQSTDEENVGIGYRRLVWDDGLILGANLFFDHNYTTTGNSHSQIGCGFEALSKWLDFRLNLYYPYSGKKPLDDTYSFGETALFRNKNYEEPLRGLDTEMGFLIPVVSNFAETRIYAGGYFYESRLGNNVSGTKARVEVKPIPLITFNYEFKEDNLNGSTQYYGGYVTLPFSIGNIFQFKNPFEGLGEYFNRNKGPRPMKDRMTEMVIRDIDVISQENTAVQQKEHDLTYVDNSNNSGTEDGTRSHPYDTIQEGNNNASGDKWVYVMKGEANYTENVTLSNSVTLWGAGYNGGFKGITASSTYPVVYGTGADDTSTITLGNNNEVMGLSVQNGGAENTVPAGGIVANNKQGVNIHHNTFSGNPTDIYYYQNTGTIASCNISNNTVSSNASGNDSVAVSVQGGTLTSASITNNTLQDVTGKGVTCYADGGGVITNLSITNNSMTNVQYKGAVYIALSDVSGGGGTISNCIISNNVGSNGVVGLGIRLNEAGDSLTCTVSNNTFSNNSSFGVHLKISDGTASLSFNRNVVSGNTTYGVLLQNDVTSGAIDFGGGSLNSEGYNSIYSNGTYDFVNFPNVRSISAENNWWGTTSPAAGQFTGTVDYNPYLSSNPN